MVKYDRVVKGGERSIVRGRNIALMITCYLYTIHHSICMLSHFTVYMGVKASEYV